MPLGISPGCPAQSLAQEGRRHGLSQGPSLPVWVRWEEEGKALKQEKRGVGGAELRNYRGRGSDEMIMDAV